MRTLLIILVLTFNSLAFADQMVKRHFKTDQCTGWSEGTKEDPKLWAHCCVEHDFNMWAGGSKDDRKQADKNLRECIEQTGHDDNARMVYLGVRLGSMSPLKMKDKKWSHAWAQKREANSLTEDEIELLSTDLLEHPGDLTQEEAHRLIEMLKARESVAAQK